MKTTRDVVKISNHQLSCPSNNFYCKNFLRALVINLYLTRYVAGSRGRKKCTNIFLIFWCSGSCKVYVFIMDEGHLPSKCKVGCDAFFSVFDLHLFQKWFLSATRFFLEWVFALLKLFGRSNWLYYRVYNLIRLNEIDTK